MPPNNLERCNENLKYALKVYHATQQVKWEQNLAYLAICFNSAPRESTGQIPSFAFLGRELMYLIQLVWHLDSEIEPGPSAD